MKRTVLRILACAAVLAPAAVSAQVPAWEKIKLSDSLQSVKLFGDLRLRLDERKRRGVGTQDRQQNRYRARVGVELGFPKDVTAVLRLASGTGEQVSTNQTYGALESEKGIWIDQAYAKWAPSVGDAGFFVQSGKMLNPIWRQYSSDIVFDEDVSPEGFGEGVEYLMSGPGVTLFANAMQMVAQETSSNGKNQWLFSQQAGFETHLPMESRLRLAAAYHKWSDENRVGFGQTAIQDGNRRTSLTNTGILLNRFGVGELTGALSGWAGKTPVTLQGTLIRNYRARAARTTAACAAGKACPEGRDGYQAGVIVGAAKTANTWEIAYFNKYAQVDSTVADLADSDFGDGGVNIRGHIFWVAYAPQDWLVLKAKGFITEQIDTTFNTGNVPGQLAGGERKAVNRLQVDASLKF